MKGQNIGFPANSIYQIRIMIIIVICLVCCRPASLFISVNIFYMGKVYFCTIMVRFGKTEFKALSGFEVSKLFGSFLVLSFPVISVVVVFLMWKKGEYKDLAVTL